MKTPHTSGPWTLGSKLPMRPHMIRGDGEDIAYAIMNAKGEEAANARLIAAAPELLAALEELAWRCERFNCDQNITTCVRGQVADAIAKAKGEQAS